MFLTDSKWKCFDLKRVLISQYLSVKSVNPFKTVSLISMPLDKLSDEEIIRIAHLFI